MLLAVFLAGLRHGFDLDHIAAITDIASSQSSRRRSLWLGTAYVVGHALVLLILGGVAVAAGTRIPDRLDDLMGRVIGASLVILGIYVLYTVIRFGPDARLRSRWMLLIAGVQRTVSWLSREPVRQVEIEHSHEHPVGEHHHGGSPRSISSASRTKVVVASHTHPHTHVVAEPRDPFAGYTSATCFGVGMIHGVGAETPSQILLFTTAAGVAGSLEGIAVLSFFVSGLMVGNTVLVLTATAGSSASRRFPRLYVAMASVTAAVSLLVGVAHLSGRPDVLPGFLGG